jgi:hypothetical protein
MEARQVFARVSLFLPPGHLLAAAVKIIDQFKGQWGRGLATGDGIHQKNAIDERKMMMR